MGQQAAEAIPTSAFADGPTTSSHGDPYICARRWAKQQAAMAASASADGPKHERAAHAGWAIQKTKLQMR